MEQQKRLRGGNVAAFGVGNLGYNFINFISNFGMLFMTDCMGMNAGIVAMLIAVSKVLDGVTDVLAGTIIDRTQHRFGKARVWIIRMAPLMALTMVAFFFNPTGAPDAVRYVYFFISYTLFNDVFYTLYYVANSTMMLYMTDHNQERVTLSIMSMLGNVLSSVLVTGTYLVLIAKFGGGVQGWRTVAVIYSAMFFAFQLVYFFGTREMPHHDAPKEASVWRDLIRNFRYLLRNRYFILQFLVMFLYTCSTVLLGTVIPYYCMRVLGDMDNSAGTQTWLVLAGMGIVLGLLLAPALIKKFGMYKANLYTRIACCVSYVGVFFGVYGHNYTVTLIFELIFYALQGPYCGSIAALTGKICEYSKRKDDVDVEATVSSCNSMGTKIGNALGVAVVGWLLAAVHYDGTLAVQPQAVLNMITGIFAIVPFVFQIIITVLLAGMDVEKAMDDLKSEP